MADKKPEPKWIKKLSRGAFIVIAILSFPFWVILGRLLWGIFVYFVLLATLNPYLLFIYIPIIYLACKKTIRQALKKDGTYVALKSPKQIEEEEIREEEIKKKSN